VAVTVKFHDKRFIEGFEKATATGLIRAGRFYHAETQRAVSIPNSGRRRVRTRDTSRGKKGSTYTVYPTPAKEGDPPRLRTGFGRKNIVFQFSGWKTGDPWVRVGVTRNALYMFWHEVKRRGQRPWMIPTLLRLRDKLGAMAMTETKRAMPK
jgi:hypothetical protein